VSGRGRRARMRGIGRAEAVPSTHTQVSVPTRQKLPVWHMPPADKLQFPAEDRLKLLVMLRHSHRQAVQSVPPSALISPIRAAPSYDTD